MSGETIELLKNYDPKKMAFPAYVSEKLDGVPVRVIYHGARDGVVGLTRQGEHLRSIDHILAAARTLFDYEGQSIVGELYIPGMPFKQISGLVRQHAPAPELQLWVFDADLRPGQSQPYAGRMLDLALAIADKEPEHIKIIPYAVAHSDAEVQEQLDQLREVIPHAEGIVVHSCKKSFQPGKRCWGTQRLKPQPTLDLEIVSYEEAMTEAGEPKGMVGRINVKYERVVGLRPGCAGHATTKIIGIGPGNMTHAERISEWEANAHWKQPPGTIIEVKYMTDDSYDALRQPTFVRFRPDKTVGDVHVVQG